MNLSLKAYALQDIGKRDNQEDCFFPPFIDPCHFDGTDRDWAFYDGTSHTDDRLFLLCDGMGGHDRGELASQIVIKTMSESLLKSAPIEGAFNDEILQQAVTDALEALRAEDKPGERKKMGTTMTILKFHADGATIGHIGDSRVYQFRPTSVSKDSQKGTILFSTKDHSTGNHLLTRVMSTYQEYTPEVEIDHITDIRKGDFFFLCSDGIYEDLTDEELCSLICDSNYSGAEKAHHLMQVCKDNTDNHTAWIINIQDVLYPDENKETMEALVQGMTVQSENYNYHIEKTIAHGGFGITYLVSTNVTMHGPLGNVHTGVKLCMKEFFMHNEMKRVGSNVVVKAHDEKVKVFEMKFRREAQRLSRFVHPNIVRVLDVFEANNTVYYVMEYLPDGSLNEYVNRKKGLPEEEAVGYIRQIGFALSYLHSNKMLHLDIKPGNIMRDVDNNTVKLIDFGLAKHYEDIHDVTSGTFESAGTMGYAPLEQTEDTLEKGFSPQLDIYALGATLYKLLTSVTPDSAYNIKNSGLSIMPLARKDVSEKSIKAIKAAMEPSPALRLQTVEEFIAMLPDAEEIAASKSKFHIKSWQWALILVTIIDILAVILLLI